MRLTITAMILLCATPSGFAFPVKPDGGVSQPGSPLVLSQQTDDREPGPATLEEAIEIAVERYGGRATSADTVVRDGREVHEIRLYDEDSGTVRTVRIDPETGDVIPPRR